MGKEIAVSTRFNVLADEFNEHDKQAGQSFVAMLNTQEEAKLEYQETTGKVHGFNEAWSAKTGKSIGTIKQYNHLAKSTAELREKLTAVNFSNLSRDLLGAYASASPEAQELVKQELEQGRTVTPKQIREMYGDPAEEIDTRPLKELINEELSSFRIQDDDEGVNLFDWSHSLMAKVISLSKDDNLKKMKPSEFADLLYEAITYSDWGEPVHASSIRDDIKMLRHFFDFGQQAMQYIQQPTAQEVRNA